MAASLARAAYSLLLRLATPLYLVRLWGRGRREGLYRHALAERLGLARGDGQTGRLWLHAVSLGETRAAAALVEALRRRQPDLRVLLTHGTATGREAGRALLCEGDAQAWLPYDTPGAVRRFLAEHEPQLGVVMETEIWPNLMHAARAAQVPMVLANARLSLRSQRKGNALAALMHPALESFTCVLAQTEGDAQRLCESGARAVQVMGNLKYDMTPSSALLEQGRAWRGLLARAVVLATSTREGEEDALLRAWCEAPAPRPLLLLVPRHPQRFDEVAALVARAGLRAVRRSSWAATPPAEAADADVWLGDSMGEMPIYYACADVALLGGSFAPLGGQNLIEAAACGCPLVMGPHTFNFAQAAEMSLAAGASLRASDMAQGVQLALRLVQPPQAGAAQEDAAAARVAMARQALAFAAQHRGAAQRMAQAIVGLLPGSAS